MRLLIFILVVLVLVFVTWFIGAWRLVKTIWLIFEVKPYAQAGVGLHPQSILVLGDSTGYGTGAGKGVDSVAGLLGADYPMYAIINHSKNGRTIEEALVEIKTLPPTSTHRLLLLQIGGNDILKKRLVDVVRSELTELYREAKLRSWAVVMISSGNVGTTSTFLGTKKADEYDRLSRQFRQMFIEVAAEAGVTYVDLFEETADDVFLQSPRKYFSIDGLHPNAAGYNYWYQKLIPVVVILLQKNLPELEE